MKIYDIEMIREFYKNYSSKIERIREKIKKPLTLSEKILFAHLYNEIERIREKTILKILNALKIMQILNPIESLCKTLRLK